VTIQNIDIEKTEIEENGESIVAFSLRTPPNKIIDMEINIKGRYVQGEEEMMEDVTTTLHCFSRWSFKHSQLLKP
jgi:hypothetical protein